MRFLSQSVKHATSCGLNGTYSASSHLLPLSHVQLYSILRFKNISFTFKAHLKTADSDITGFIYV